jgi:hypothetical protein
VRNAPRAAARPRKPTAAIRRAQRARSHDLNPVPSSVKKQEEPLDSLTVRSGSDEKPETAGQPADHDDRGQMPWFAVWLIRVLLAAPPVLIAVRQLLDYLHR